MKRILVVSLVLGSVLVLCAVLTSAAVADPAAEQTPQETAAEKQEPEDKPSDEDKPVENPQKPDETGEDKPKDKPEDTPKPAQAANVYERKILDIEKRVAEAEKLQEKVGKAESKVNTQISKMLDSSKKPVDTALLRKEIAEHHPSGNAKTYHKLTLTLAAGQEKVTGALAKAWSSCLNLKKMVAQEEDLKTKGEALVASVKDQYIAALMKLATFYERISETKKVTDCYAQILKVDKNNSAALSYFKELKKKKEGDGGSAGQYGGGNSGR